MVFTMFYTLAMALIASSSQVLILAIQKLALNPEIKIIEICYDPNNLIARNFYLSFGFEEIGMDSDNEEMLATLVI